MTGRLQKEFRAILPIWLVTVLLAAISGVFQNEVWWAAYWASLVALAVAGFGNELNHQTFLLLLAQPVARSVLWREKLFALTLAFGSAALVFVAATVLSFRWKADFDAYRILVLLGIEAPLCALAGGVCLTLFLRQVQAAFWLAALLPGLLINLGLLLQATFWPAVSPTWMVSAVALPYVIAGYWLGWRCFLTWEDVTPLGKEYSFGTLRSLTGHVRRMPGAVTALALKELLLQQISCVCAVLMLFCLATTWVLKKAAPPAAVPILELSQTCLLLFLTILFPAMCGGIAIAEERKLGLLEWQQAAPPSRRKQWWIKLSVSAVLTVVIQVVSLIAIFTIGDWRDRDIPFPITPDVAFAIILPFGSLLVGFWASSLARSLVHSLGIAAGVVFVLGSATFVAQLFIPTQEPVSPRLLFWVVAVPSLVVLSLCLCYRNYLAGSASARLWRKNVVFYIVWLLAVTTVTAGVYNRFWEKMIPEPRPDPLPANSVLAPAGLAFGHAGGFIFDFGWLTLAVAPSP